MNKISKIRRIDDLGRVVIPKEIRKALGINVGDPLEVRLNKTGQIIIETIVYYKGGEENR